LSGAPTRRLFFALWPDDEQRAALVQASCKIVRHCGGRPVPASNLHVTLAFLGSVPEPRLEQLSAIGRRVAATYPQDAMPLTVSLEALEHWSKPQVLAVVGRQDESQGAPVSGTAELARTLTKETAAAGFCPDLKPFRVHVTVARKVARPPRTSAVQKVLWSFDAFALIESRTLAEGPVYSVVESHLLGDSEKLRT
jgi:RNA 2',3'-cyclic 3'-phosphodiesterase